MIVINGRVFTGKNISIINGQVIQGSESPGENHSYDETKREDSSKIDRILITTGTVPITISRSSSSEIVARMYGEAKHNGTVDFDVTTVNRDLKINLNISATSYVGTLRLEVNLPEKIFHVISVETETGNLTLKKDVFSESLQVETQTGNINCETSISDVSIITQTGNVNFTVEAIEDLNVYINTQTGKITTTFRNICGLELRAKSTSGRVRKHYTPSIVGYYATARLYSQTGNITIQ